MLQKLKDELREVLARRGVLLVQYAHGHRAERLRSILRVRQSSRSLLLNPCEAAQLLSAVKAAEKVPGALAEVGVASGTSARMIAEQSPGKILHLFDTFSGLPKPSELDAQKFRESDFNFKIEQVRKYLDGMQVVFHPGMFPAETGKEVEREQFSFVHLDVDLYESTLNSLIFFYPRLSRGGIILSHDYVTAEGVNRAFEEFFRDKPEPVIELTGYQCLVVKAS
jgi:predicted O-methyltransferase YrrM